jgi:hypothetical protein
MIFKYPALSVLFIALVFTACDPAKPADTKADFEQQAKALVDEHFKLLNEHELKSITAQYAPKATISSSDWKGIATGPSGADQIFHLEFYISPDARYLVDRTTIKDSTVVVEYDVIGLKNKANGVRYDLRKCSIFKTDGQQITSEATYANPLYYQKGNN